MYSVCRQDMHWLATSNPGAVQCYRTILYWQNELHHLTKKILKLIRSWHTLTGIWHKNILNLIDQQIVQAILCAEKQCRILHIGEVSFSSIIQELV